jgi:hypothetical protein
MKQEAPRELQGTETEGSDGVSPGVILVAEPHGPVFEGQEAVVGDGHLVGVAGQVLEHLFGSPEGWLGIDDPLFAAGLGQESVEGGLVGQRLQGSVEGQLAALEGLGEKGQKFTPEDPAQDTDREEELGRTGHPACSVQGQAAGGHHAVEVGMVVELLTPGMEQGEEADASPEVPGIGADLEEGLGGRLEEEAVNRSAVLEG